MGPENSKMRPLIEILVNSRFYMYKKRSKTNLGFGVGSPPQKPIEYEKSLFLPFWPNRDTLPLQVVQTGVENGRNRDFFFLFEKTNQVLSESGPII